MLILVCLSNVISLVISYIVNSFVWALFSGLLSMNVSAFQSFSVHIHIVYLIIC